MDVIAEDTPRHAEEEEALSHARVTPACTGGGRMAQGMTHAQPGKVEHASQEEAQGGRRPMQEATPKFSEATIGATPDAHREEAMQGRDPICHTRGPGTHAEEEEATVGANVTQSHSRGGGASPRERGRCHQWAGLTFALNPQPNMCLTGPWSARHGVGKKKSSRSSWSTFNTSIKSWQSCHQGGS